MLLSKGCFQVLFILQKFMPIPFAVNDEKNRFEKRKLTIKSWKIICQLVSEIPTLFVLFPIALFRMLWLILHWKSYTIHNVDEFVIFGIVTCSIVNYIPVFVLFHSEPNLIIGTLN